MQRLLSVAAGAAAIASHAPAIGAQIDMRRIYAPAAYVALSAGLANFSSIQDEKSGSDWEFGQGIEWRATWDHAIQNRSGIGLSLVYASVPLDYTPPVTPGSACSSRCEARADVWSIMAGFHSGGGLGFHQVLELEGGVTHFAKFRTDDGDRIDVGKQPWDVSLTVGYGFGIGISPRTSFALVQDFGLIFHPDRGSGSSTSYAQKRTIRIGIRYGLGQRR